jgi:hypothetical protein
VVPSGEVLAVRRPDVASKACASLRKIGKVGGDTPARSAVGDEITRHLRALQAERREALAVDEVVSALVPAIAALAERGLLVSVSVTRDARSVRLSALIDREWVEWYADEREAAEDLSHGIVGALGD